MAIARIKNWSEFQHYKDRSPPWLKLHRGLLDDFDFARLPIASKALAPMIWLLASESEDGSVNVDPEWLSFRLRCPIEDVKAGLTPLIAKGFVIVDSAVLAPCLQVACLEGEAERETEGESASAAPVPKSRKRKKAASSEVTFSEWAESLGDAEAITTDDPIFTTAAKAGIPRDFVGLAWMWFESTYGAGGPRESKRYANWRQTFRNAVEGNWADYWAVNKQGEFYLTTKGVTAQRALA